MTDANIIIVVNIVCATIITVVMLLTRRDINTLTPKVKSVEDQLIEANKFIIQQGHMLTELRDNIAMRKPSMTKEQIDKGFENSSPYRTTDK